MSMSSEDLRREGLREAVISWGPAVGDFDKHARQVTLLARVFTNFLAAGTVRVQGEAREPAQDVPVPVPVPVPPEVSAHLRDLKNDFNRVTTQGPAVIEAALRWTDRAHLKNASGPENWRNWADDHDIALINAVLAYRGMEPLERKPS